MLRALSIVVPVFNEEESLEQLFQEITAATTPVCDRLQVIFVDDGSSDGSVALLRSMAETHPDITLIEFRRNFGKAAALDAGFRAATGDVVFTMDADLQDDPAEIPDFLNMIDEGYEVVSGWKQVRHDPLGKTLPSKVFNAVVSRMSGIHLNDFNCGFKAYTREALQGLNLYGELHRFIPVLLHWQGFKVGEKVVNHRPRQFGHSKYGFERLFKGALDLFGVVLNTRYATRPLHVFGLMGAVLGVAGMAILSYLTVLWFVGAGPIGNRPLLFLGMLMVMSSLQFLTVGLLGEFIQRQNASGERRYVIRQTTAPRPAADVRARIEKAEAAARMLKGA
ncbi:MAG: glycosyltransferase family 2 protein [Pseudomonadota bacterium]